MLTYDDFKNKIQRILQSSAGPLSWTEIRTAAKLPEKLPNNKWVRKLEQDIALQRSRDQNGIIKWKVA